LGRRCQNAIEEVAKTLRELRVAEVVDKDLIIRSGKVEAYRTKVKLSFKYEGHHGLLLCASPSSDGKNLKDFAAGRKVMKTAAAGKVGEITYWWPRPGSIQPLKKHTFYTKVGSQICSVGYWE
jgi:flavin-binding protein dodecin